MKRLVTLVLGLALALTLSACGSDDSGGGGGKGSCSDSATSSCVDYTGSAFTSATIQQACGTKTYSASACTTTSLVGSCKVAAGSPGETILRFYSPGFDATTAQAACTSAAGVWIP